MNTRRKIPNWFTFLALGFPLAFVAWAGTGGAQLVMNLP